MTEFNKILKNSGYLGTEKPVDDRSEFRKGATGALMNTIAGGKALLGAANSDPRMQYEAINDMARYSSENQAKVGTIEDINGIGEFGDWLSYNLGSGTSSIGQMVATGGVGGLIGKGAIKYGAGKATASALQATGAGTAGFLPNYGESLNSAYQETGEIKNLAAFTAASIKTSLDMFTPLRVLKASGKADLADGIADNIKMKLVNDNRFKSAMIDVSKTMGIEAVTEAAQSYVDQVAANYLTNETNAFGVRDWSELINSAAAGAAGSMGFGAYGGYQKSREAQALRQQSEQQNINADELLNDAQTNAPSVEQSMNSGQDVDLTGQDTQQQPQQPGTNYDTPAVARQAGVTAPGGSALFGFSDNFVDNASMRQGNNNAQANPMVPMDQAQTWQPNFTMGQQQTGMGMPNTQVNGVAPYTYEGEFVPGRDEPRPSVPVGQVLNAPIIEGEFENQRALPDRTNVIYGQDGRPQQQSNEQFAGVQQELAQENSNLLPDKGIVFGEDKRDLKLNSKGKPFKSANAVKANKAYRDAISAGNTPNIVEVNGGFAWESDGPANENRAATNQDVEQPTVAPVNAKPIGGRKPVAAVSNQQQMTKATTPQGRDIDVEYQVVEADELIASNTDDGKQNPNYPQQLQPRDRTRANSELQINNIANNLKPELLAENPLTSDGAPIISSEGVVESGNGRTLAIRRAYNQNKAEGYRGYLKTKGFDTTGMNKPVLVRVRKTQMNDQELQAYTKESNERTTLSMSSSEQAKSDSKLIEPIIDDYVGGDLIGAANRTFVRKFMTGVSSADQASMVNSKGELSQDGQKRIQAAIVSKAYGDETLVSEMFESTDSDMKSIGGALLDIAGSWSKMRSKVTGEIDITDKLIEAVNKVRQARAEGRSIKELVNQDDMFAGEVSPLVSDLINVFYNDDGKARSKKAVSQALASYSDIASNTQTGEGLFGGDLEQANAKDILEQANEQNKQNDNQSKGQTGLFDGAQDAGQSNGTTRERPGQQKPKTPERENSQDVESFIDTAANEAATSPNNDLPQPTQGQKEAGNYKKGRINIQGLNITIENPKGSERTGIDSDGKPWSTKMNHHYGDIKGTKGADGDAIDTFIGSNPESDKVFVVDQNDVATGDFDEHKVMLGFNSKAEAKAAYLSNYNKGFSGFGEISETTMSDFKEWIAKPRKSKQPFAKLKENNQKLSGDLANTDDVGMELSYNRRSWLGITNEDLQNALNDTEKLAMAQKGKVWKRPNYQEMVDGGLEKHKAYFIKLVYDAIASKPKYKSDKQLAIYVDAVGEIRDSVEGIVNSKEFSTSFAEAIQLSAQASRDFMKMLDVNNKMQVIGDMVLDSVLPKNEKGYRWGSSNKEGNEKAVLLGSFYKKVQFNSADLKTSVNAIMDAGWPAKQEMWQKSYVISKSGEEYLVKKKNRGRILGTFNTKEAAEDFAKEDSKVERGNKFKEPKVSLNQVERIGADYRNGKSVSTEKVMTEFGLRGINFGNWIKGDANAKERQLHINHIYDGLMDLSVLLNIPPKAIGLNGMLGVAVGAQGSGGKAAAHFVPGLNEINITRNSGAGSLAHEWGHALDHYFGVQAGKAKSDEPFLSSVARYSRNLGNNIRPEIVEAYSNLMKVIRNKEIIETPQEVEQSRKDYFERSNKSLLKGIERARSLIEKEDKAMLGEFEKLAQDVIDKPVGEHTQIGKSKDYADGTVVKLYDLLVKAKGRSADKDLFRYIDSQKRALSYAKSAEEYAKIHRPQGIVSTDFKKGATILDDGAKKPYWATDVEMFARSFEMYVLERLADSGKRSDYMTSAWKGEPDGAFSEHVKNAYPQNKESVEINKAFDELISQIQTKEGDNGNVIMFNRAEKSTGKGISLGNAELITAGFIDFYSGLQDDMIVTVTDKKPSEIFNAAQLEPGDDTAIKGGFDKGANRLYIFPQNHSSNEDVRRTLREELLVHKGLGLFKPTQVKELLDAVSDTRNSKNKKVQAIWADIDKNYAKASPIVQAEEFLGKVAQNKLSSFGRLWNQVIAAMTRLLRQAGLVRGNMTIAEMNSIIFDLSNRLRQKQEQPQGTNAANIPGTIKVNGKDRPTLDSEGKLIGNTVNEIKNYWLWRDSNDKNGLLARKGQDGNAATGSGPDISDDGFYVGRKWETPANRERLRELRDSAINDGNTRFYHGTKSDITEFNVDSANKKDHGWLGKGIYVSPFRSIAENYANLKKGETGASVMPLYARINNPIIADETLKYALMDKSKADIAKWTDEQIANGFDSVVMTTNGNEIVEVVVFEANQLKSAVGNNGNYSAESNDIRFNRVMSSAKEKLGLGDQEPASIVDKVKSFLDGVTPDNVKEGWSNWRERATEGVFDSLYGIKKAEEAAGIDLENQGYVSARLAAGVGDVVHAVMFHGAPEWRDGIVQRKEGTKGLLEVFGQLDKDQLNDWLAWMAGNRANKLMKEGRENNLEQSEIDELMQLNDGREGLFNRIKNEYNQINSATLDLSQEAGLVDADVRASFDDEFYVPFFRDAETEDNDVVGQPFSPNGIANQNANLKKLKGSKLKTNDILQNILMRQAKLIEASMKNKAMLEVIQNLDGSGAIESAKLNAVEIQQVYKNKGKTPFVSVMDGGDKSWYKVNDPALLRGLMQLNVVRDDNPWIKMGRAAKRFLTIGVTMSPEFIFRNFIRDSAHGWMINKDKFKFGIDSVKGAAKTWKKDQSTLDMMFAGASFQGGYVHATDPEASAQQIRRALRKKGMSASSINDYLASIPKNLAETVEKYREFSDGMENANRASTYTASLAAGKSKKVAAFEAKDFMDFSLQGNYRMMQTLVDLIPFLNARLQGMYKLKRASINEGNNVFIKRFSKELATKGMMVAGFSIALAALNSEEERYKDLQDWDKDANWHFFLGDTHIRIPKPFELGIVFGTMPERMFHLASGDQKSKDIGKSAVHAIVSTMAFNPLPQFVKPALEAYTNYDIFGGRDIDSFGDMRKRPEDRYSMYTTGTAKNLGELFGWSPKRVDHVIRGYGGTLASYVLAIADGIASAGISASGGEDFKYNEVDDLSLVRAFVQNGEVGSSYFRQEYYDMLKEVNAVYGQYKTATLEQDLETANEILKDNKIKLRFRPMFNKAQAQMNKLNQQTNLIWRNKTIPRSQRENKLDELSKQKNALAKRIILMYREYED